MSGRKLLILGLLLSPLVAFFVSMMLGSYGASPSEALAALVARLCGSQETVSVVITDIRLPRVVTSLLVGMALAISGATLQGVLRNPLVDPYILGLSSGAAFGAALAIAVWRWIPVSISAFVFALVALAMTYFMARTKNSVPIVNLVLSGVITSAVFTALLSIVQITSHEKSLQAIVLWTMGSFNGVTWSTLKPTWLLILLGCFFMIGLRWRFNVLTMGETEAKVSGLHVERYRVLFIVLSALVSALSVSMVGVVALLGLIVPHIVRMLLGPDHRILIPVSAALGAALMAIIDTVARTATGFEIPVSIITTLVGAPVFWLLLRSTKAGQWQ